MIQINKKHTIINIFGPTASGKSDFALTLANKINGCIINADSAQVYKEAPILSNIPSLEERQNIKHFLFGFKSLKHCNKVNFSVYDWLNLAKKTVDKCRDSGNIPIFVGGTGLYFYSMINGINNIPSRLKEKNISQELLNTLGISEFKNLVASIDKEFVKNISDPQRLVRAYEVFLLTNIPFSQWIKQPNKHLISGNFINIYLCPKRNVLYDSINKRTNIMINKGALEEVEYLKNNNILTSNNINKIIGLLDIKSYLDSIISFDQCINNVQQKTRNYAKRQITWFNNKISNNIKLEEVNQYNIFIKNMF